MKRLVLKLFFLGVMLSLMSQKINATTVDVISNKSSGIANANLTTTLDDGTILGFFYNGAYSSDVYLCGAISQQTELTIPDSIFYLSKRHAVNMVGFQYSRCDFDNAQKVTSLILPATIKTIHALPPTLKNLHVNSYIQYLNSEALSSLNKVLVPKSTLNSYFSNTNWSNYVLINVEGTEIQKITINMSKAGEFAQLLLQQTDNWLKVNELTVVGELNAEDLNVFKRMKQLTKLDLSRAVINDIPAQFDGVTSIYNKNNSGFNLLETLSLPEINIIGYYAFAECHRLKNINIPKVNIIGQGAFSRIGASQITLPEGITSIGAYAFYESGLQSIVIPPKIKRINDYCFSGCSKLKTVTIPTSVTEIGKESFRESGITSVSLLGVKTIANRAFYNCNNLVTIDFAEGLSTCADEVFSGCTALTEIDIPSTLCDIGYQSFAGCSNIKKVTSRAVTPPSLNNGLFFLKGFDMTDVKLYVPTMSIDKYRVERGWKEFYTILPLEDKTSNIHIYDNATIDDLSEFTTDCNLTIDYVQQNRTGTTQYYCGSLDYNGKTTLSMHNYSQYQYMGLSNSSNQYSYGAHFTSLIPNGTMRSDNVQTTLRFYDTSTWYFISLPYDVKVSDIIYTDGAQFVIRKYSGHNRAQQSGNTWINLTSDDIMNAYEGYILRCNNSDAFFTFPAINNINKNKVFEKGNATILLGEYLSDFEHSRSWNLIGNPYPCYYDIRYMDFTAPITVWNRYNKRYDAYSPIDDSYILHPAQAFFVQRPIDKSSIIFNKAGRQKNANVQNLQTNARSRAATNSHRKIFNVLMSNGSNEDHTRFVINDKASLAYELDKDASKIIANDNSSMLVYTVVDGEKYAINERPKANGEINVGFYAPTDGEYSLSLCTDEMETLTLIDHETNAEVSLSDEYHFTAKTGYNDNRFTIMFGEITSLNSVKIDNGTISCNCSYTIYTIDGRLVGSYNADTNANLSKGIYIINSKDVKRKIVVK